MSSETTSPPERTYCAFISYSHRDEKWAAWLHRKLETYRGHKRLIGTVNRFGAPVPARLYPVFRDREELEGAADLPTRIQEALRAARCMIVVCSPNAAASPWVDQEIRAFRTLKRDHPVLALIVSGEPNATDAGQAADECFPTALRYQVDAYGTLSAQRAEPLAADARKGKDGERGALLKIAAGLLGVPLDTLRQRDAQRRQRIMALGIAVLSALVAVLSGLTAYAFYQERTANAQRLATESRFELDNRHDLALLLATEAVHLRDNSQTRSALLSAVLRQPNRAASLIGHSEAVRATAFSDDGRMLATGGDDGRVVLWSESNGRWRLQRTLDLDDDVTALAFTPDGATLVAANRAESDSNFNAGELTFWNVADGERIADPLATSGTVWQARFTSDGQRLATADGDGRGLLWEVMPPRIAEQLEPADESAGFNVAVDPDSLTVAVASDNAVVLSTRAGVASLPIAHENAVSGVAFSTHATVLATADEAGQIVLWDVETRSARAEPVYAGVGGISRIEFAPSSDQLAVGGADGSVTLWDTEQARAVRTVVAGRGDAVASLTFAADGLQLAIGLESGRAFLADLRDGESLVGSALIAEDIWDIAFRPNGALLAATGQGVKEVDLASRRLQAATLQPGVAGQVAASVDGQTYAFERECGEGREPPTEIVVVREVPSVVEPCGKAFGRLAFHPDGGALVVGRVDGTVGILDGSNGWQTRTTLGTAADSGSSIDAVAFSGDGELLALGRGDGMTELWRWRDLEKITEWRAAPNSVTRLAFNPVGTIMATANYDGSVILWNVASGTQYGNAIENLSSNYVEDVAFSRDGTLLATAADNAVILWEVATQQPISERIVTHDSFLGVPSLWRVAFTPDGASLVTAGIDGYVFQWDLRVASWVRHACYVANRDFTAAEREFYGIRGAACPVGDP